MRTVQITLEDKLINAVDRVSKRKIGSVIISLPPAKMGDVGRAIRFALDI